MGNELDTNFDSEANKGESTIKFVIVPEFLRDYRGGINFAFYNLALGKEPKSTFSAGVKKTKIRFTLTEKGNKYFKEIKTDKSIQDVFTDALLWLSEQGNHVATTKI